MKFTNLLTQPLSLRKHKINKFYPICQKISNVVAQLPTSFTGHHYSPQLAIMFATSVRMLSLSFPSVAGSHSPDCTSNLSSASYRSPSVPFF